MFCESIAPSPDFSYSVSHKNEVRCWALALPIHGDYKLSSRTNQTVQLKSYLTYLRNYMSYAQKL